MEDLRHLSAIAEYYVLNVLTNKKQGKGDKDEKNSKIQTIGRC